tara:strand:- start:1135 stop:1821 length:687 start_codon:yes stop_codon:yes gene_type:complete
MEFGFDVPIGARKKRKPLPYFPHDLQNIESGDHPLTFARPDTESKRVKFNASSAAALSIPTRSKVIHNFGKAKAVVIFESLTLPKSECQIRVSLHWPDTDTTELTHWFAELKSEHFKPAPLPKTNPATELPIYYTLPKSYDLRVAQEVRAHLLVPGHTLTAYLLSNRQSFTFMISRLDQLSVKRQHSGMLHVVGLESSGTAFAPGATDFYSAPAPKRKTPKSNPTLYM